LISSPESLFAFPNLLPLHCNYGVSCWSGTRLDVTGRACEFLDFAEHERFANALPFRSERKGITAMAALGEMTPLLLVVHGSRLVFLALCGGSVDCDGAALAIRRDNDMGRENNLPVFFGRYMERAVVNFFN